MPYHVKTPGALEVGDVYWKGNDAWTKTYADRTQFANKADADAIAATTVTKNGYTCLLYTSPSPRDGLLSRMPSSA